MTDTIGQQELAIRLEELETAKRLLTKIPAKYINSESLWSNGYNDAVYEMKGKLLNRIAELAALGGSSEQEDK